MVFKGVFTANELTPAPCGILSVAEVIEHSGNEYDERWIRGFSQEHHQTPSFVRLLTVNDEEISTPLADNYGELDYYDYIPFFIEVESFQSTLGVLGEDRYDKVKKQLENVTQKALEREFWEGFAADAENIADDNFYLRRSDTVEVVVAGAKSPEVGLMHLEQALSESSVGQLGVIHMTRDVASILGSRLIYVKKEDGTQVAMTRLGTKVIIGMGYTGNGPRNLDGSGGEATTTNKWMFATGKPTVHLGKIEVVPEELSQATDTEVNNVRIKAYRPAAVTRDPSLHFAMRVTLPND
jgi:hypothetical protein